MRIEILWVSGAIECHTVSQADGGMLVDAKPLGGGRWGILARSTYGSFVKHEVAPVECSSRREYAAFLARETRAVLVDGMDFRGAILEREGVS